MKITNTGRNLRVINAKDGDRVRRVAIEPGATVEVTPIETPVFKALRESGTLTSPAKAKAEEEAEAKRAADEAAAKAKADAEAKARR